MTELDSQSTYDNSVYGGFALADIPTGERNTVKASLLYQKDIARIQDDAGLPWDRFDQGTLSAGTRGPFQPHRQVEGHRRAEPGLLSTSTRRREQHLAQSPRRDQVHARPRTWTSTSPSPASPASRPCARSTPTSSGNPDLLSESGTSFEFATTWSGPVYVDRVRLLQPLQELHRHGPAPGRDAAVLQRRQGPHQRLRGPGPEEPVLARGDGQLHLSRPPQRHRRPAARRPAEPQPQLRRLGLPGQRLRIGFYGLLGSKSWWWNSRTTGQVC